ncbi:MAG TPA: FAD-dependent oxidoreductase, partial [Acidimicrobiia bacterium]|nr:FAD-dependent oxidoreductase [Acidimicrobiia bacterium]
AVMARAMRARAPHVPVLAVHRILTPDEAEGILANGDADGVTLARALIADPEWAAKARDDRADEIRRCTGCNQGCYGNLTQGYPITCVTNPGVGRESALGRGTLTRAPATRRVVVVGGGPAGLEAAWVAAARGHSVVLLERSHELGGRIRLAQRLPARAELADFADWRIGECARRGVEVHLRTDATVESILAFAPDAVIVATGGHASVDVPAKSHPFPLAGGDRPWVIDHERAIAAPESLGAHVVVLDAVGDIAALGTAHLLAEHGRDVTLVSPMATPMLLDAETLQKALPRAVRAGVRWRPNTAVAAVGDRDATLVDVLSYAIEVVAVDHLVVRTHGVANDELFRALAGQHPDVRRVGDAVAVRPADRAIFDGHLAGRAV